MRDNFPLTPELQKFTSGGKYPNYLVRSWASSLGSVTQGHKALKSNYRSKWLERLNRMELLQNVEVQQTLRNTMRILKVTDNILQDSDSAYEFAKKRRVERCHETVCKIRERELNKRAMKPLKKCKDDPENRTSTEKHTKVKKIKQDKTSDGKMTQLPVRESDKAHTSSFNFDHSNNSYSFEQNADSNGMNDYGYDINGLFSGLFSSGSKLSSMEASKKRVSLPAILEGGHDQDKNDSLSAEFPGKNKPGNDLPSFPSLDTQSKFSIIKRVQEIRQERCADNKREKLLSLSSQVKRKYSKARKESLQNINSRKIEIFADNSKILSNEQETVVGNSPVTLPLLDSKSFAEIDCNDYLNLKNRLDGLSPEKAVLDHKTYWPASS